MPPVQQVHPGRLLPHPHLLRPPGGGEGEEASQRAVQRLGGLRVRQLRGLHESAGEQEERGEAAGGGGGQELHVFCVKHLPPFCYVLNDLSHIFSLFLKRMELLINKSGFQPL